MEPDVVNSFDFLVKQPPPGLVWLIILVSLLHLIVAFVSFLVTQWREWRKDNKSIEDDFWFRKVVVPACLTPLSSFVELCSDRLTRLNEECATGGDIKTCYQEFQGWLIVEKNVLLRKFRLVRLVKGNIYDQVAEILDGLEDNLNGMISKTLLSGGDSGFDVQGSEGLVLDCEYEILSALRKSHHKI